MYLCCIIKLFIEVKRRYRTHFLGKEKRKANVEIGHRIHKLCVSNIFLPSTGKRNQMVIVEYVYV